MSYMFSHCSSLKSINLSSFNTTNVNNMYRMFEFCSSLELIDLSSFNTTNINNMKTIFFGCNSLKKEKENIKINNKVYKQLKEIENMEIIDYSKLFNLFFEKD